MHLRAGLGIAMDLASNVNKYLDTMAPWSEIKKDKAAAAKTIYTALRAIDSLKIIFSPYLPFTCERLHATMGYSQTLFGEQYTETLHDETGEHIILGYHGEKAHGHWQPSILPPGQILQQPAPLFKKLDESTIEEERSRLGIVQ